MTSDKINGAIRACLEECYESSNHLATLAEFTSRLRDDPAWRDAEIAEVEVAVRQMLKGLLLVT